MSRFENPTPKTLYEGPPSPINPRSLPLHERMTIEGILEKLTDRVAALGVQVDSIDRRLGELGEARVLRLAQLEVRANAGLVLGGGGLALGALAALGMILH